VIDDFSNALISLKNYGDKKCQGYWTQAFIKNYIKNVLIKNRIPNVGNIKESIFMKNKTPMARKDAKQKFYLLATSQTLETVQIL
jgi:hypothetical protein